MALAWVFAAQAGASELFDRPIFTKSRNFIITTPRAAIPIAGPIKTHLFQEASATCGVTADKISSKLQFLLSETSPLWNTLDRLFPKSRDQAISRGIVILIDDFSQFAGDSPEFASYYLPGSPPIIGLDCSKLARSYWLPSLAHEFTHALLNGHDEESWWEEGLAQLLEKDAEGEQPVLTLQHLETTSILPPLLETRRPLPSRESYAIAQLFVHYVQFELGGWPMLQAMSGLEDFQSADCETDLDFLSKITCRGRAFAANTSVRLNPEKLTRSGLLRYFAVALTLNDPATSHYSIPEWSGWTLPRSPKSGSLLPGQFAAWTDASSLSRISSELETYRVLSDGKGNFQILTREQALDPAAVKTATALLKSVQKDFVLALNLGLESESIFK